MKADRQKASGSAKPSFMVDAVSNIDEKGDLEHQQEVIKDTAATVFLGKSPLLGSTGHLVFFLNLFCSCCRDNTFSHTDHLCSNDFLPRSTVKSAGGA